MLPEYEIAIARGHDIEPMRKQLSEKARTDFQERCRQIDHDAKVAELVMYVLRHEPTWSPGYGVARGLQKRFKREHPEDNRLAHELRKAAWIDDEPDERQKARERNDHESDKGTAEITGEPGRDDGSSEESQAAVSTGVQGES